MINETRQHLANNVHDVVYLRIRNYTGDRIVDDVFRGLLRNTREEYGVMGDVEWRTRRICHRIKWIVNGVLQSYAFGSDYE